MNTDTELAADVEALRPEANKLPKSDSRAHARCARPTGTRSPSTTPGCISAHRTDIGRRNTSFGAWLEECERHDSWHELPEEQRKPTLANVAAFLDDYADFEPVK
jgi:hypothetical protein